MAATKGKISAKQKAIDKAWAMFNSAMDDLDDLSSFLDEIEEEFEVDVDRCRDAVGDAHNELEKRYSYGASILPKHSGDGGKA